MTENLNDAISNLSELILKKYANDFIMGKSDQLDVNRLAQALGGSVSETMGIDAVERLDPDDFVIKINPLESLENNRFIIAREIGNIIINRGYKSDFNKWVHSSSCDKHIDTKDKLIINHFATTLLMPKDIFMNRIGKYNTNNIIDVLSVSKSFGVKVELARSRGIGLNVFA